MSKEVKGLTSSVVSKEQLLVKVKKAVKRLPVSTCFVAGVTKVKSFEGKHQMMLEIVQSKDLRAKGGKKRKENMTAAFVSGDSRFSTDGDRTVRIWKLLNVEGYEKSFPQLAEQLSGEELHDQVGDLVKTETREDVLCILTPFNKMTTPSGRTVKPTLSVVQYSDPEHLPTAVSKILAIDEEDRSMAQEKSLEGFMMYSGIGEARERLVDEDGNQVYEIIDITYVELIEGTEEYEAEENTIIVKQPLSVYQAGIKEKKSNPEKKSAKSPKENMEQLSDLID
jgi:hypothetical protein